MRLLLCLLGLHRYDVEVISWNAGSNTVKICRYCDARAAVSPPGMMEELRGRVKAFREKKSASTRL